jgi:hypothetical protein
MKFCRMLLFSLLLERILNDILAGKQSCRTRSFFLFFSYVIIFELLLGCSRVPFLFCYVIYVHICEKTFDAWNLRSDYIIPCFEKPKWRIFSIQYPTVFQSDESAGRRPHIKSKPPCCHDMQYKPIEKLLNRAQIQRYNTQEMCAHFGYAICNCVETVAKLYAKSLSRQNERKFVGLMYVDIYICCIVVGREEKPLLRRFLTFII